MGGTTAKAGLIENGEVRQSPGQELGAGINISRILQGGGYYVGAATVDLAEVGAGGGSIAWLDSGGILKVGPHSAGADPGPIAYGLGGDRVTVSDANFLLGRIPAEYFLGGEMKLDLERARRIVQEQLAKPLNITVEEACAAVVEVANANMLQDAAHRDGRERLRSGRFYDRRVRRQRRGTRDRTRGAISACAK